MQVRCDGRGESARYLFRDEIVPTADCFAFPCVDQRPGFKFVESTRDLMRRKAEHRLHAPNCRALAKNGASLNHQACGVRQAIKLAPNRNLKRLRKCFTWVNSPAMCGELHEEKRVSVCQV